MRITDIEVMLHHAYKSGLITDAGSYHTLSPAYQNAYKDLLYSEMLERADDDEDDIEITDKGRAFVDALQQVPLPKASWKIVFPIDWEG